MNTRLKSLNQGLRQRGWGGLYQPPPPTPPTHPILDPILDMSAQTSSTACFEVEINIEIENVFFYLTSQH